ncbi:mitochondrial endonuclease G [Acrasis kona]|uniref:Mitochondrial endonuclease G n=1 Tax=Acrasis kona TaxID=1008807 RepID=A0AAW2ZDH8_9EUKA
MRRLALASIISGVVTGVAATTYVYEGLVQKNFETHSIALKKAERETLNLSEEIQKKEQHFIEQYNVEIEREKKLREQHPILNFGLPNSYENYVLKEDTPPTIHVFRKYISEVDFAKKTPKWVANTIYPKQPNNPDINRKNSEFKQDPDGSVPVPFRSSNDDYWNSGYHRGHMIPAGDLYTADVQLSLDETFYLTNNIVPQNGRNNSGYWRRLEQFVRKLPSQTGAPVHVITGPLYLPSGKENLPEDPKRRSKVTGEVRYPVIGENQVHVPTHLFKVILAENSSNQNDPSLTAFLIPNEPVPSDTPLRQFEVDVKKLEKLSGLLFFQRARLVTARNVDVVEKDSDSYAPNTQPTEDHSLSSPQQFILRLPSVCDRLPGGKCQLSKEDPSLEYMFEINDATTVEEVDKIWKEHQDAKIDVHDWTKSAYERKKEYFDRKAKEKLALVSNEASSPTIQS